jgi:hypothetical protein
MTVQNPHDCFFRESFGRPEIARDYMVLYYLTKATGKVSGSRERL